LLKAKLLTLKAKDSKFVLEDTSGPRTKAKDNNTGLCTSISYQKFMVRSLLRELRP